MSMSNCKLFSAHTNGTTEGHEETLLNTNIKETEVLLKEFSEYLNNGEQNLKVKSFKFISRLLEMLSNEALKEIVSWSTDGESIEIKNLRKFIEEVLPKYFNHNSMPNFTRQLNIYNFKKVRLNSTSKYIAYRNSLFKREASNLIPEIKRNNAKNSRIFQISEVPVPDRLIEELNKAKVENCSDEFADNYCCKLKFLELRVFQLEKANETISNCNSENCEKLLFKSDYIRNLESALYYIIQYFLSLDAEIPKLILDKLKTTASLIAPKEIVPSNSQSLLYSSTEVISEKNHQFQQPEKNLKLKNNSYTVNQLQNKSVNNQSWPLLGSKRDFINLNEKNTKVRAIANTINYYNINKPNVISSEGVLEASAHKELSGLSIQVKQNLNLDPETFKSGCINGLHKQSLFENDSSKLLNMNYTLAELAYLDEIKRKILNSEQSFFNPQSFGNLSEKQSESNSQGSALVNSNINYFSKSSYLKS